MTTHDIDGAPPEGAAMDAFHAEDQAALVHRVRAASPARRPSRKRRFVAGGFAVVVVAGGGAAYAALNSPPFVDQIVNSTANEHGQHLAAPQMVKIADLTLPDGSRFAAWHGQSEDLVCDVNADNWDGKELSGTGGGGCGPVVGGPDSSDHDRIKVAWAAGKMKNVHDDHEVPEPWYPVVYGYVADPDIVSVSLSGTLTITSRDVDLTVPINPSTRGFAAVLPGSVDNKHYPIGHIGEFNGITLRYLDARGHQIRGESHLRVMQ